MKIIKLPVEINALAFDLDLTLYTNPEGDRYDIDLDLLLDMGMGAILVDGVEDVYELPGVLARK